MYFAPARCPAPGTPDGSRRCAHSGSQAERSHTHCDGAEPAGPSPRRGSCPQAHSPGGTRHGPVLAAVTPAGMQITGLSWCGTRTEDAAEVAHFRQRVLGLTPTYTEPDCPGTQARPGSTFEDLMVTATNSSSADTSVPAARALSGHAGLVAPRAQPAELTIPPSAHHDLLCVMQVRKWTSSRTIQNGGSVCVLLELPHHPA
jgi:hypothetical protein